MNDSYITGNIKSRPLKIYACQYCSPPPTWPKIGPKLAKNDFFSFSSEFFFMKAANVTKYNYIQGYMGVVSTFTENVEFK